MSIRDTISSLYGRGILNDVQLRYLEWISLKVTDLAFLKCFRDGGEK